MKSHKIIVFALVLAVMVMGAGYAAASWNEQLVGTTDAATGELNVEFVQQDASYWPPPVQGAYPRTGVGNDSPIQPCYATAQIAQNNAKRTTVTISNLYPGVTAYYDVKIKNTGSIPAIVKDVTINTAQTSEALNENLIMHGSFVECYANGSPKPGQGGVFACKLVDFESTLNGLLAGKRLEKDEFITFDISGASDEQKAQLAEMIAPYGLTIPDKDAENCIFVCLPPNAGNDTQEQTAQFDLNLNFKQFNQ